jgi:hypothetical protein
MTLQQYFDRYHLNDTDADYDDRWEYASCFVCDAQESKELSYTQQQIYSFAEKVYNVEDL